MTPKPILVTCPRCKGHKAIPGVSEGLYKGPATLPCPRCPNSSGEVPLESLTEVEKNPPLKKFYERDDNP